MSTQKIAQVCISKTAGLKKGQKPPIGNLLPFVKGTWTIPEEDAKDIVRLEAYAWGEFLAAYSVKSYSIGEREGYKVKTGIVFDISPIYEQRSGTFPYDNYKKAWILHELEGQKNENSF